MKPQINVILDGEVDHIFFSNVIPVVGDKIVTAKYPKDKMIVTSRLVDYRDSAQNVHGEGQEIVYLTVDWR